MPTWQSALYSLSDLLQSSGRSISITSCAVHGDCSADAGPSSEPARSCRKTAATSMLIPSIAEADAAPAPRRINVLQLGAEAYDALHEGTGLPWWATICTASIGLRLLLLPLSLRQAKIIRTNYGLWREAKALTEQQATAAAAAAAAAPAPAALGRQANAAAAMAAAQAASSSLGPARGPMLVLPSAVQTSSQSASQPALTAAPALDNMPSSSPNGSPASCTAVDSSTTTTTSSSSSSSILQWQLEDMHAFQQRVRNFNMLRCKAGAPHPSWIIINPLLQVPAFMFASFSLRAMGGSGWPGLSSGGALWFPDLTQAALVLQQLADTANAAQQLTSSALLLGSTALLAPMGGPGFILPLAITALMLTSIRIGYRSVGVAAAQDTSPLASLLRALPPVLYTLTLLNTGFKVQLPHAVLVHWAASSSFTLGLQLAMKNPAVAAALGLPAAKAARAAAAAKTLEKQAGSGRITLPVPSSAGASADIRSAVAGCDDTKVLVVLGAQKSAMQQYADALYCLERAVQLAPDHTRAHYAMGQVFSMTGSWSEAEACFRRCAETAQAPAFKGQALHCIGTALQSQGLAAEALQCYEQAAGLWVGQPIVYFSIATARKQLGQVADALAALEQGLLVAVESGQLGMRPLLQGLQQELLRQQAGTASG